MQKRNHQQVILLLIALFLDDWIFCPIDTTFQQGYDKFYLQIR